MSVITTASRPCPRCGLDSLRYWEGAPLHCTDPSCEWPKLVRA